MQSVSRLERISIECKVMQEDSPQRRRGRRDFAEKLLTSAPPLRPLRLCGEPYTHLQTALGRTTGQIFVNSDAALVWGYINLFQPKLASEFTENCHTTADGNRMNEKMIFIDQVMLDQT